MSEQPRQHPVVTVAARARLRREIDEQVRAFLQRGGQIEVVQRRTVPHVPRAATWEFRGVPDLAI
ncbi:MAG: hypothetical protein RBS88_10305 [Spongiibacteraceae bacterium]|nr:hypothetical protein [Spongiibacteraceae bacterium]